MMFREHQTLRPVCWDQVSDRGGVPPLGVDRTTQRTGYTRKRYGEGEVPETREGSYGKRLVGEEYPVKRRRQERNLYEVEKRFYQGREGCAWSDTGLSTQTNQRRLTNDN